MACKNFSTVCLEHGVLFRVLYRFMWSKENTEGRNGGTRGKGGGERENLKAILKPSSLFPLLSLLLPPPPPIPFPSPSLPGRTGGRILIQPRWLTDKPDGFDGGCEVFRSRLSTIQRKLASSLSLSLGWPYFPPPQAAALAEEMWWKFRIRYSTLVGSRAEEEEEVFGRGKSFSTGIFASELPMLRGELAFPEVFRPPLFFPSSIHPFAD